MDLSTIKLFPDNLVSAIGNTLVHSLWQGLILAAVTALIIIFTRKASSARRYNLLIAALVSFACVVGVTFIIEFNRAPVIQNHARQTNNYIMGQIQAGNAGIRLVEKTTLMDNVIGSFNKNANTIVLIWFLIVLARSLQLLTGLNELHNLRHKNISRVDGHWERRLKQLALKLGIRQVINIAESGIAKVPMIIGHLKPLILIPVGLMAALSTEEIEAILVHELAHIRRRDFLVNLLQSLMEIVFFFNPAVLWISALIKTERENCCDDIAVAHTSNKINYIKALVSCQEHQLQTPAYAMALKGKNGHLVTRVKRMLSEKNQSLSLVEKSLLAVCLVTAGLITTAFSNAGQLNKLVSTTANAVTHASSLVKKEVNLPKKALKQEAMLADTVVKKDSSASNKLKIFQPDEINDHTAFSISNYQFTSYLYKEKGVLYQLNYKRNVLISMQVNGKQIAQNQIPAYQSIIDAIPHKNETAEVNEKAGRTEPSAKTHPYDTSYTSYYNGSKSYYNGSRNYNKPAYQADSLYKLKNSRTNLNGSVQKLDGLRQDLNERRDLAISDSVNRVYKKNAVNSTASIKSSPSAYLLNHADYNAKPYVVLKDDERRDRIIDDMLKDGLITTRDNLSFKISSEEFIVNDKKQADNVYQKYRAKYVKITGHGEWSWLYNYDTDKKRESNTIVDNSK